MFISVIPLSHSLGKHPYTYSVSETWESMIVIGGLVEIPLGRNLIQGLICEIDILLPTDIDRDSIRPIHAVLSSTPILSRESIVACMHISDRYFLLIHKALGLFLPAPLIRRLEKRHYVVEASRKESVSSGRHTTTLHHFIEHTLTPGDIVSYSNPRSVLIFPDDTMLAVYISSLSKEEKQDTLIIMNEGTAAKRVQAWIDIYEGKYSRIVGTRRILYYNLGVYKNIIYIEDAFGMEQYQYPSRIRSLDILKSLSESHIYDITILSSTPTLELLSTFSGIEILAQK